MAISVKPNNIQLRILREMLRNKAETEIANAIAKMRTEHKAWVEKYGWDARQKAIQEIKEKVIRQHRKDIAADFTWNWNPYDGLRIYPSKDTMMVMQLKIDALTDAITIPPEPKEPAVVTVSFPALDMMDWDTDKPRSKLRVLNSRQASYETLSKNLDAAFLSADVIDIKRLIEKV